VALRTAAAHAGYRICAASQHAAHTAYSSSFVGERFGNRALGAVISLSSLSTAVSSYVLSADMASTIYTQHITGSGTICYGAECYRATFLILAALNAVAVALGVWLTCRLRTTLYCGEGGKAVAYTSYVAAVGVPQYIRTLQRGTLPWCCCTFGRGLVMSEEEEEALGLLSASRRGAGDRLDESTTVLDAVVAGGERDVLHGDGGSASRAVPLRAAASGVAGSINRSLGSDARPLSYTELPRLPSGSGDGIGGSGGSGSGAPPPLSPIAHVGSPVLPTHLPVGSGPVSPVGGHRPARPAAAANVTRSMEWEGAPLPGSLRSGGALSPTRAHPLPLPARPGAAVDDGEELGDTPVARRL